MAASSHALLGPSSSHRWINCTPSARLEEKVAEKSSDFAQEGSCAHALCEEKLWVLLGKEQEAELARTEQNENNRDRWYCTEMETCAEDYASSVWNKYQDALKTTPDAKLFVERRLNFEQWIPNSFGTADAVIIADDLMEVIDFKYGKGVEVSAVGNTQMMIYALGAIAEFELEYNIKRCKMTIIQPRLYNTSEYELSVEELHEWSVSTLMPASALAWKGEGEQKAGEWCRFCKIKATCSKMANQAISVYTKNEVKEQIAEEDYPRILALIPAIKSWASAFEDYATAQAIQGKKIEGYKIVEGRSIRKVTDSEELVHRLSDITDTDSIYKPRELKSIGELEKLVGKKQFAQLSAGVVDKPQGKPTLVPISDKRQEMNINSAITDFADVVIGQ